MKMARLQYRGTSRFEDAATGEWAPRDKRIVTVEDADRLVAEMPARWKVLEHVEVQKGVTLSMEDDPYEFAPPKSLDQLSRAQLEQLAMAKFGRVITAVTIDAARNQVNSLFEEHRRFYH